MAYDSGKLERAGALITELREDISDKESRAATGIGAPSPGGAGLTDAQRERIASVARQTDDLLYDTGFRQTLLTRFASLGQQHGHPLPDELLPEILVHLVNDTRAYMGRKNSEPEKHLAMIVRGRLPAEPQRAASAHAPPSGHAIGQVAAEAPPPPATRDEAEAFLRQLRSAAARHQIKLQGKAHSVTRDAADALREAGMEAGGYFTGSRLLSAVITMGEKLGTEVPARMIKPLIPLLLEEFAANKKALAEPNAAHLVSPTARLGAFGPRLTAEYAHVPDISTVLRTLIRQTQHPEKMLAGAQALVDAAGQQGGTLPFRDALKQKIEEVRIPRSGNGDAPKPAAQEAQPPATAEDTRAQHWASMLSGAGATVHKGKSR